MDSAISAIENVHAASVRQRAVLLLEQLMMERERLEAALCERRRPDQLKEVTGASSLDAAIASTRRMIADLDAATVAPATGRERMRMPAIVTRVTPLQPVALGA